MGTEQGRQNNGMLELSDDFSYLEPMAEEDFTSEGGKIIILWREKPLKKYETSFMAFSEDFNGTDDGVTRVYLCAELMERIPEELRASTPDEAVNIVMAETFYLHSGTLSTRWGDDGEVEDPPTEEEIRGMFSEEESVEVSDVDIEEESAWQYVPFFTCLEAVSVYNAETGGHSFMNMEIYDHEELRRNPAAADLWDNMRQLLALINIPTSFESDVLQLTAMRAIYDAGYYSFLEESVGEQLAAAVEQGDVTGASGICENEFWDMAETLKTLDPDAGEGFGAAIEIRSYNAMQYIAGSRGYTSVAKSHDRIQADKSYTGQPDLQALNDMLLETVDMLENDFEWDMFFVSLLAALG